MNPLAMVWKPSGTATLEASSIIRSRPRKSSMPARVTMKAGMPTEATQKPCQAPTSAPTTRPRTMASGHGTSYRVIAMATVAPTNAATDPTDRSMWPAMMTITIPIARIRM